MRGTVTYRSCRTVGLVLGLQVETRFYATLDTMGKDKEGRVLQVTSILFKRDNQASRDCEFTTDRGVSLRWRTVVSHYDSVRRRATTTMVKLARRLRQCVKESNLCSL